MNARRKSWLLGALVLVIVANAGWEAQAKDHAVPDKWKGKTDGSAEGNPLDVDGKPLWRVDGLVNADPMNIESYKPLVWATKQKRWQAGGVPGASNAAVTTGPKLVVGGAGPASGKPGQKMGVLVFIAPRDGTYGLSGRAVPRAWQGNPAEKVLVLKLDRAAKTVSDVASLKIESDDQNQPKPIDLSSIRADLKAGQELAILTFGQKPNGGCNILLEGFKVVEGAAPASQPTTQPAD